MNQPMPRDAAIEGMSEGESTPRPVPSWFPQPSAPPEEPAGRYRLHNEEPMAVIAPQEQPARLRPAPRTVFSERQAAGQRRYYREYPHEAAVSDMLRRRPRSRRGAYVAAGLVAMLAGGVTGFGFSHLSEVSAFAHQALARIMPPGNAAPAAAAVADAPTAVDDKLVATATLDVADVQGDVNSLIPLMLRASPAPSGADIMLKVSGLPKEAYLTAGSRIGTNDWLLNLDDAQKVKLVVPHADAARYDVSVAAVEAKSGQLAAPVKEMTVAIANPDLQITPASAAPETAPAAVAIPAAEVQQASVAAEVPAAADYLQKGDMLLNSGDMAAARQFYERAFTLGSADGALGAGKTYDPNIYRSLNVQGLAADPVRAMEWYMRAASAGQADANAAIAALKTVTQ